MLVFLPGCDDVYSRSRTRSGTFGVTRLLLYDMWDQMGARLAHARLDAVDWQAGLQEEMQEPVGEVNVLSGHTARRDRRN